MGYYLSIEQVQAYLRHGKAVEQWLNLIIYPNYNVIRWLRIDKEQDAIYTVTSFQVFDDGNEDFFDVYAFSPVEPDEPYGKSQTFKNDEEAMEYCLTALQASSESFVTAGMIQKEYELYRK